MNPEHLLLGTQAENMHDRKRPGRVFNKLTREQVADIKQALHNGEAAASIARAYQVSPNLIGHIKAGRQWNDVPRTGCRDNNDHQL